MTMMITSGDLAGITRDVIVGTVRRDGPDVTARQLAIFLIIYTEESRQTVRGLALRLSIGKPAVSRSLDRLGLLGLVKRIRDPDNRRSVFAIRTEMGTAFLAEIQKLLLEASTGDSGVRRNRKVAKA